MKKENQQKLLKKYSKIFAQYDLPPSQTAMCWGLECGDGWCALIDALCENIQKYIDNSDVEQIVATQVKQKFGALRFYYRPFEKEIDKLIWQAANKSMKTCEHCGATKGVKITITGWRTPLCRKCFKKSMEKK